MKQLFRLSISVSLLTLINLSACAKNDLDLENTQDVDKTTTPLADTKNSRQNIEDLMLAEMHFQLGHYGQADQYYSKLLTSHHDIGLIRHAIKAAFKCHDFEKALKLALLWHKESPNSMSAVSTVIGLYQQLERYDDVVVLLEKYSVSGDAIDLDTVVSLLEQHSAEESYQSLFLYIQKFMENNDQAVMQLALFALRAKLFEEAINASERLSTVASKDIVHKIAIIKVQAYTKLHKPELALKELQMLIKQAIDAHTKHKYARIMATLGKIDDSITLLTEEFKNSPQYTPYLHDIISIYLAN
ncbi:MAG TPA: hypothetical protein EYH35_00860, partial [Thiotrichaceae bacterium]|nr:hypothetical protein [Thiotrichaceae bacterium]